MRQLLILSGKGGTGKTTVATAMIHLAKAKAYGDCDVDAPNLHLLMKPSVEMIHKDYYGMSVAMIDQEKCSQCGLCIEKCRFDAIRFDGKYEVDPFGCEGCGVCEAICPSLAITLEVSKAGDLMLYKGESVFSTAQLKMGRGTSGMLVTEVKKNLKSNVSQENFAIIDGSPGIGCPVIASISGVDMVLIVAEPSLSGISDMERIIETAKKFQTKMAVCVNKYDTNHALTNQIVDFCTAHEIPFTGRIPYDQSAVMAINNGMSVVELDCESGNAMREVFAKTMTIFKQTGDSNNLFPIR